MTLVPLFLALATLQQQPAQGPPAGGGARDAAFDTAGAAVNRLGLRVAEVKSALEQYRRAVFNGADGEVLNTAARLHSECRELDSTAAATPGRICLHCGAPRVQVALRHYRAVLPSLARVGSRCASRVAALSRGADAAKQLRGGVRGIGNAIVQGFRPYETRLEELLAAIRGAAPPAAAPRPAPLRPPA